MNDPHYADATITLHHGDCLDVLRSDVLGYDYRLGYAPPLIPDNTIDSITTDPPYGLGFMGREWDELPPGREWAEACLRVLKPGGHLLAFGGTRTWHRLAVAVEDAGFEMRDSIAWLYGSGFPKSLDVSKAIDKAGGVSPAEQAAVLRSARERAGLSREDVAERVGCTASSVRDWEEGRARTTGAAVEFITPRADYRDALADLLGYTADERKVVGAGGGSRGLYETGHRGIAYGGAATPDARTWEGWGTALKPAFEPIVVARKPLAGTVAANVLAHGTGALNIDGCRVGDEVLTYGGEELERGTSQSIGAFSGKREVKSVSGRWPANVVLDESQAEVLDEQSGDRPGMRSQRHLSPAKPGMFGVGDGANTKTVHEGYNDTGGASRFFYVAKADQGERVRINGTAHPTVKPIALMRWLVRLVTPPGGTVLEPFAGSGTTVEACILEGFRCVAIEREAEYLPLITQRIHRRRDPVAAVKGAGEDGGLFDLLDGGAA